MKSKNIVLLSLVFVSVLSFMFGNLVQASDKHTRPSGEIITIERTTKTHKWTFLSPGKAGLSQVRLKLATVEDKPISGKKIVGELLMPEMPMVGYPMELEFVEDANEPGIYTTLAQYMHGGFWRISVKVPCCNEKFFLESFDFDLSE